MRAWAAGINHQLEPYAVPAGGEEAPGRDGEQVAALDFEGATDLYARVVYAREQPGEEELVLFGKFWDGFHRALRKDMGTVKYLLNIWRI